MPKITEPSLVRNGEDGPSTVEAARAQILDRTHALMAFALAQAEGDTTFAGFEQDLGGKLVGLARAVVVLFLVAYDQRVRRSLGDRVVRDGRTFRWAPAQPRNLLTWFGVVRYGRA